ncbi:unnamed protein product [Clavelina lepadiformis]|uniref:Uncharacterized protein n=1 Tax=Clavelina lepadiformis TaxID=159417 RepID=A0ABP0FSV2_CLALP
MANTPRKIWETLITPTGNRRRRFGALGVKSAPNSKLHCARLLWKPVIARMVRIVIMLTVKRKKESQFLQCPDIRHRYENGGSMETASMVLRVILPTEQ